MQSPKYVLIYKQDGALDKNRTIYNVQEHNICTNVPSSQNFRSHQLRQDVSINDSLGRH
jgi:hypothetical protein